MTPTQWVLVAGLLMLCGVLAAGWLGVQFATAPYLPPSFDEHAATACAATRPVSRPELRVDTATGSHDHIPMREDNRQMLADYCEGMWHHQPTTTEES